MYCRVRTVVGSVGSITLKFDIISGKNMAFFFSFHMYTHVSPVLSCPVLSSLSSSPPPSGKSLTWARRVPKPSGRLEDPSINYRRWKTRNPVDDSKTRPSIGLIWPPQESGRKFEEMSWTGRLDLWHRTYNPRSISSLSPSFPSIRPPAACNTHHEVSLFNN